jgi:hypothetical protein
VLGADRGVATLVVDGRRHRLGQPGLGHRRGDRRVVARLALLVLAGAESGVEAGDGVVAALLLRGGQRPQRAGALAHHLPVLLGDLVALVQHAQAHQPPRDGGGAGVRDLGEPAGGTPGERAAGVEEELDRGGARRDSHRTHLRRGVPVGWAPITRP